MNTKFTFFALSIVILSMVLSAAATPKTIVAKVRILPVADTCKYSKRSAELFQRYAHTKTCPCTDATARFTSNVVGEIVFSQNNCGSTLVTGLFSDGLNPLKNTYFYYIVDLCGNILYDLTPALCVSYRKDGTWPFLVKLNNLNLDCNSKGVLLAECTKCFNNSTFKPYHKRQFGTGSRGSSVVVAKQ
ncbi:hypothetical protein Glove_328g65 [Diversispora epigaea]|uniref:Cyanovirin-N domain-containing protein n=1 Tax=Diversispora epigaea TaxID=1348612 RepID=A0A397HNZ5_9GLOM|nr:hypothetical protein Glove_328g65 [Diversispora epigaea]